MGHNFSSEPVVEKETERDHNDTFNVAVSSCQGWRTTQEDNHSLILELPGPHKAAFFAVYDGHGSARVSKHASEELWKHLVANELYIKGNFREALESSFLAFDREVNESYNAQLAGTTAVCVLIVDNVVYCANIGDSRAVASVNCECVPLSYDHKPENPQELKRILAAGGYVLSNRVNGNLALSRAFGDFHYKGNEQLPADQQIVSPCPDVTDLELKDDVDFLVLACDGIWDVLSSEEVVEFVINRLRQEMPPGLICEELTTRCLATDYELVIGCDNMTVLLICYTRGRSWEEYCEDIHLKYTSRLRNKPNDSALPLSLYNERALCDPTFSGSGDDAGSTYTPTTTTIPDEQTYTEENTLTTTNTSDEPTIEENKQANEDVPSSNNIELDNPTSSQPDDDTTTREDESKEPSSPSSLVELDRSTDEAQDASQPRDDAFCKISPPDNYETCKISESEDSEICRPTPGTQQEEMCKATEAESDESNKVSSMQYQQDHTCEVAHDDQDSNAELDLADDQTVEKPERQETEEREPELEPEERENSGGLDSTELPCKE